MKLRRIENMRVKTEDLEGTIKYKGNFTIGAYTGELYQARVEYRSFSGELELSFVICDLIHGVPLN